MNVYITAGTYDFLKRIESKYINEKMVTMVNENGALLLHETSGETVFKEPRRYEVLETIGEINKEGFVLINNIPLTEEGRPLFEHQLKNRLRKLENEPGFLALRVLRPLSSNTYVILTVWENEALYQKWQNANSLLETFGLNFGVDPQQNIFTSSSYKSKYSIIE